MATKSVNKIVAQIERFCDAKIAAAGNAGLQKKWATVKVDLIKAAPAFDAYGIDAKQALPNAIYAAQKTGKLMRSAALGINVMDRYTNTVLVNARKNSGALSNKLQNAALSKFVEGEFGDDLVGRLHAHTTTASTQASSTRKALEGVGLCAISDRVMNLTLENPLGERLLAIVDGTLEPIEEKAEEEVVAEEVWVGAIPGEEIPMSEDTFS